MGEEPAHLVGPDLPDVGRRCAEARDADRGVGGRAARDHRGGAHRGVERFGARLVDEVHAALRDTLGEEEIVLHGGDDVHDGIADAEDVGGFGRHAGPLGCEGPRLAPGADQVKRAPAFRTHEEVGSLVIGRSARYRSSRSMTRTMA